MFGTKLKYLTLFLVILIFLISACATQPKQIVCNKPYILVGNDCCLDEDDNSICDSDETKEEAVKEAKSTCNKPYIQVGSDCCLDKNNNKICDKDETVQEETNTLTIEDLQADMGNVVGGIVVLTKDTPLDYAQVFSNKISNAKFLGKYGQKPYSKVIIKKPQKVIQITDSKYYLNDNEDFQNFVKENYYLFIETALDSKKIFENDFEVILPKTIYLGKFPKHTGTTAEKTKYISHSELSSILFYDNITFPETVSENIANINYIRINNYEITVDHPVNWGSEGYTETLSNINYGQSIVIQCSPNLVIGLSFEDYGDGSTAKYDRGYDRLDVNTGFFTTSIRDHYQELIRDAQALVKMCEKRYEFTYVRER